MKSLSKIELTILAFMSAATLIGVVMSHSHPDVFRFQYTVEDGLIEWLTVLALISTMVICFYRTWKLRKHAKPLFLIMTFLFGLAFLFGAGEEISWGQRLFNVESPEFFKQYNAQGETNLHNTIINDTKINKLVFGKGIGLLLLFYMAVFIPLYRYRASFKKRVDQFAIPIATNYQIAAYVITLVIILIGMDHSKKGELLEFSLTWLFLLNFWFPQNAAIYKWNKELQADNNPL
jgi:hypothetical protein